MTVLSPSAERLTVVSRIVPKTVQLAKWQMFAGEDEEEAQQPTRESTPTPQVPRGSDCFCCGFLFIVFPLFSLFHPP